LTRAVAKRRASLYREFAPPAPLARLVRCLWLVQRGEDDEEHLTFPDVASDLVFTVARRVRDLAADDLSVGDGELYFVGPMTRVARFVGGGPAFSVGVRFEPWGAAPLVGAPLGRCVDGSHALAALLGAEGEAWQARLRACTSVEALLSELTAPLWSLARRVPEPVLRLARLWPMLAPTAQPDGTVAAVSVAALVERSGLHERQLRRDFDRYVGVSPRAALGILRLHRLLQDLADQGPRSWAEVAARHGYFDQAHFINDVRRYTQSSPARLWS
jgi:AraC-like DNA-binding protein